MAEEESNSARTEEPFVQVGRVVVGADRHQIDWGLSDGVRSVDKDLFDSTTVAELHHLLHGEDDRWNRRDVVQYHQSDRLSLLHLLLLHHLLHLLLLKVKVLLLLLEVAGGEESLLLKRRRGRDEGRRGRDSGEGRGRGVVKEVGRGDSEAITRAERTLVLVLERVEGRRGHKVGGRVRLPLSVSHRRHLRCLS